ncbi:MAG: TadE/TadG family type IV pilus assembly protein [Parvularculaceae bacterium]
MSNTFKRMMVETRGSIAVLFAVAGFVLFIVAGAAIDYNRAVTEKEKVQASLDAAMLAALSQEPANASQAFQNTLLAQLQLSSSAISPSNVTFVSAAQANNYNQSSLDLSNGQAYAFEPDFNGSGALEASLLAEIGTTYANPFGSGLGVSAASVAEHSEAPALGSTSCVYFTDPRNRGLEIKNGAEFNADCTVYLHTRGQAIRVHNNGVANLGGYCAPRTNNFRTDGNGVLTPANEASECSSQNPDPFGTLSYPTESNASCSNPQNLVVLAGQTVTLDPAVNCGNVTVATGGTLVLNPGVHTFEGNFNVADGGTLEGDNVLLVLEKTANRGGNRTYRLDGNVDLSGLQSGDYEGFVIFQADFNGNSDRLVFGSTSNVTAEGLIYLPNCRITLQSDVNEFATRSLLVTDRIAVDNNASFTAVVTQDSDVPFPGLLTVEYGVGEARLSYKQN